MTELVIEELEANDREEGRLLARQIVALAKKGNASLLKVLYDRIEPTATPIEDSYVPLTDDQRADLVLKLLERAAAQRAGQGPPPPAS